MPKQELFITFAELVLHPRSNGTVNCVDMEKVRLRVRTVPVQDLVTHEVQTLYSVLSLGDWTASIHCASGMTLRDAISSFCNWFEIDRRSIELLRPFLPQGWEDNGNQ